MSRSIDFISKTVPGYGPHNGRCLTYSGVSGKTVGILFNSSRGDYKLNFDVKFLSLRCASRRPHSVCNASSSSYRRNSDFSRQKKQGFSRNRNRNNEYRDGYEDLEESETFSSKNGPLLSVSGNHKFQATANPGPREKEIVELFRKVQARLRERAAMKEEKKVEDSQGKKSKESDTVDSLLKLLRKHSVQQGKKNAGNASSKEFILNEPKQVGSSTEERRINISDSDSSVKHETRESPGSHLSRPKSNFQRRSPVPEIKFLSVYPNDLVSPVSQDNLDGIGKEIVLEPEAEHIHELEIETDSESYVEPLFSEGNVFDEMEDETSELFEGEHDNVAGEISVETNNLSGMKLTELKALAKSRGLKGFSKLKKNELILLLSESSI